MKFKVGDIIKFGDRITTITSVSERGTCRIDLDDIKGMKNYVFVDEQYLKLAIPSEIAKCRVKNG